MAQGVRAQVATGLACGALLLWAACSDAEPIGNRPSGNGPIEVDLPSIPDADLARRIEAECHGPLRGQLSSIAAIVTLPGDRTVHVFARLPNALRTADDEGIHLLDGDRAMRLGEAPRPATAEEAARLRALRELLDAATLGPLLRTRSPRRLAADTLALDGGTTLRLRPRTLLPAEFAGPWGTITIDDYLHTPVAWLPKRITHPTLGACRISFEKSGVRWQEGFFRADRSPSEETKAPRGRQIRLRADAAEPRSPTPILVETRPTRWLLLDDPGTWPERAALYTPLQETLLAQGQKIAGFPALLRDGDRAVLAIPFRAREGDALPPCAEGRDVLALPAGRELVVYPPAGNLETRRRDGERMLRAALEAQDLKADGPIRCQPYLHLDEAVPEPKDLENPIVRLSVRVR